jgi:hypothetical protein
MVLAAALIGEVAVVRALRGVLLSVEPAIYCIACPPGSFGRATS